MLGFFHGKRLFVFSIDKITQRSCKLLQGNGNIGLLYKYGQGFVTFIPNTGSKPF